MNGIKQFLKSNVPNDMLEIGTKVIRSLILMMTFAAFQLVTYMGQHFLKSLPWMKEFSDNLDKK
ncbi:hypothetical protein [Anaerotignum sp.]|uniref:hypothetical protein n=1 Tax=Anaerotignum sp. TaxID=2039241 RepID=UPI00289D85A7|nr:hypothetical protein [Anaerotignum sp.]